MLKPMGTKQQITTIFIIFNMFILDTDFIFAYFDPHQSTHLSSTQIIKKYGQEEAVISNLTKQELATVISYKIDFKAAQQVLENLKLFNLKEVFIDQTQTDLIWEIFHSYSKKKVSFVDCSNLFLATHYKAKIASFDNFYPKNIVLK
jgi:predicted nucleic acid-binding protein